MKTRYVTIKFPLNDGDEPTITDISHINVLFEYCNENNPFKMVNPMQDFPEEKEKIGYFTEKYGMGDKPVAINVTEEFLILTYAFELDDSEKNKVE